MDPITAGALDEFPEISSQRCLDFCWHHRYPQPKPPRQKKDEVFVLEQYKDLDRRAKQISIGSVGSIPDLVNKLTMGMMNDLDKVRAIFTWLGEQKILNMDLKKVRIDDIVKGYLKIVKDDRCTYTELMAILCREARIPCVVLAGLAKGAQYDVGDMVGWRSSWNAVYVAEAWRFIHPQWAFCKITGQENNDLIKLESNETRGYMEIRKTLGKEEQGVEEFFFLTDPEQFIHFCCADDPKWQLLKLKVSTDRFLTLPYVHPRAFQSGVSFKRSQSCIQRTENGECRIPLTTKPELKVQLKYDLCWKVDEELEDRSVLNGKESLVIKSNMQVDGTTPFLIRCIVAGEYRLRIYKEYKDIQYWLCDFKIKCEEPKESLHTLPFFPEIGWGPGPLSRQYGLNNFSHLDGFIVSHDVKVIEMSFKMTRTLSYHVQMKHHRLPDNELLHSVKLTSRYDQVCITVNLPDDGEFVLKIAAKRESEKDAESRNILNYVIESDPLQRKYRGRDNPAQKKARQNMREAVRAGNKTVLSIAIERFRKADAEDKNDLSRAMETLGELEIKEDLKFAMLKNRYDKLDGAITKAQASPRYEKFHALVLTAIEQKEKLKPELPRQRAQLEVTKRTLADLKCFKKPPVLIYEVLKAAYMVLGEKPSTLEKWTSIRTLLHKSGRDGLDYRLQNDPGFNPEDETMLETEAKATEILNKYDANTVGKMSPAGETVFLKTLSLLERRQEARDNPNNEEATEVLSENLEEDPPPYISELPTE